MNSTIRDANDSQLRGKRRNKRAGRSLNALNYTKTTRQSRTMNKRSDTALSPEKALYKAAAICSRCEQSEADIRTKLSSWGVNPGDADTIIDRLKRESYLSEERYAHAFVRDKFRFAGWGRIKIAYAMRQKRIDETRINEALAEINEEEYREALFAALRGKLRSVSGRGAMQQRAALYRFAASRGYESSLISSAIASLLTDSNCDCCDDVYDMTDSTED